ncbi:MAG TPA: RagB/SusD family nutrient uptake outer membrane protein [Chitinophaga sp.]
MKKIYNILFLSVAVIAGLDSCKQGLKDETYSVFDASKLTKPENGNQAVIGTYAALKDNGGYGYYAGYLYWLYEYPADVVTTTITSRQGIELDQLTYNPSNSVINAVWVSIFKMISRANEAEALINSIDYKGNGATDQLKQQHLGEVRFLRALAYYDATSLWGDVPLILKASAEFTSGDLNPPLAKQADVETAMISDLTFATENLPASYNESEVARATSGAAHALLARLYLRQGAWQKAADEANAVITGGAYRLKPRSEGGLKAMFDTTNRSDKEFIFVLKSSNQPGAYGINSNSFGINSTPWDLNRGYGNFPIHLQFYSIFDKTDDRRNLLTGLYHTLYGQVMSVPVEYGGIGGTAPDTVLATYIYNLKYPAANNYNYAGFNNVTILRYADVLLMRAEALNELNGPTAESADLVSQIRTRSGLDPVIAGNYNKNTFRDLIFDERNKEFFMEGRRREDLLRWGKSASGGSDVLQKFREKVVPLLRNAATYDPNINYVFYPYPQNEIQSNTSLSATINQGRYK